MTCCARIMEKGPFEEEKNRFATALDLIKYLKHIEYQNLLHTCAYISELPSYMGIAIASCIIL